MVIRGWVWCGGVSVVVWQGGLLATSRAMQPTHGAHSGLGHCPVPSPWAWLSSVSPMLDTEPLYPQAPLLPVPLAEPGHTALPGRSDVAVHWGDSVEEDAAVESRATVAADHVRSYQIMSDHVRSCQIMSDHVRTCQIVPAHGLEKYVLWHAAQHCTALHPCMMQMPMGHSGKVLCGVRLSGGNISQGMRAMALVDFG